MSENFALFYHAEVKNTEFKKANCHVGYGDACACLTVLGNGLSVAMKIEYLLDYKSNCQIMNSK